MAKQRPKKTKKTRPLRVLFAASEAYPLIKTGGLADVAHALPNALAELGLDIRLVLPAHRPVLAQVSHLKLLGWLKIAPPGEVRVWQARHRAYKLPLLLIDAGSLFDREGDPYSHPDGHPWPDNPLRYSLYSRAVALLANDALNQGWRADILHANDWQTGLAMACNAQNTQAPRSLYTIHNLAYDCQFDYAQFQYLRLPPHWWSTEKAEFYDNFSLMKAGLNFADTITTVSPRYAEEIRTPEYGYGYAGILNAQSHKLHGILNGIDTNHWNPATDPHLAAHYQASDSLQAITEAKQRNQQQLLKALKAPSQPPHSTQGPLIGFVGRLVYQKGIDLLLDAIPQVLQQQAARFAIIGSGDNQLERQLQDTARAHPNKLHIHIGYSEALAHQLEAGADLFVMPSRYEPCGLNQLYSLRYGTPPIVRDTGGLADSVTDDPAKPNGYKFQHPSAEALSEAILRAINNYHHGQAHQQRIRNGMAQDLSWAHSARQYHRLYQSQ